MSQSGPTTGFTPHQLRWAEAENARRKHEFDEAYAAWYAERSELASMQAAVEGFGGQPTSYSVVLKREERLLYELPHVSLVEVQRDPGHYTSGYSGFSFRVAKGIRYNIGGSRGTYVPGTEQHKITDEGTAAITTQRVIFQGSKNSREWAYSKLLGIQHDDTRPFTLMHVSNRQKVSGLVYPATEASTFRFYVALAIARFQDQQAAFSATVASQLAALVGGTRTLCVFGA